MRLNAPKKIVWLISLILAVVSIISYFVTLPIVHGLVTYLLMCVAWLLLFLGAWLKGF